MLLPFRSLFLASCALSLLVGNVGAADKKAAPADAPNFCDVYGPGYRPVGTSGTCIKIDGSIDVGIGASSSGGQPSAAASTDWIKTKPAKNGN
jgi:hypothetical protein